MTAQTVPLGYFVDENGLRTPMNSPQDHVELLPNLTLGQPMLQIPPGPGIPPPPGVLDLRNWVNRHAPRWPEAA